MKKRRWHYGIVVCVGCTLALFCVIGTACSAFSAFLPYVVAERGLTKTQASMIITIRNLVSLLTMILIVRRYYLKMSLRAGTALAVCLSAAAFVIFAVSRTCTGFYIGAILAGIAYGTGGTIPVSILINRWFTSHRTLALGLCSAGTGVAVIAEPPVIAALIVRFSLQTAFLVFAALIALAAAGIFCTLRDSPEEMGTEPFGGAAAPLPERETQSAERGMSGIVGMLLGVGVLGGVTNVGFQHFALLHSTQNVPAAAVSALLSVGGLVLTVGKCLYGAVTDRLGAYRAGYLFFGALFFGLACCLIPDSGSLIPALLAVVLMNFGTPLCNVGISVYARDVSDDGHFAANVRYFQIFSMIGASVLGPMPGLLADRFKSYIPAYAVLVLLAIVSAGLIQGYYIRRRKA